MVTLKNALAVLDIQKPYAASEVQKKFRLKALNHHPDKKGNAALFLILVEAKNILLKHCDVVSEGCGKQLSAKQLKCLEKAHKKLAKREAKKGTRSQHECPKPVSLAILDRPSKRQKEICRLETRLTKIELKPKTRRHLVFVLNKLKKRELDK